MGKIKVSNENLVILKKILDDDDIIIEGNILKFIDTSKPEVAKYVEYCTKTHKEKVKRRLELSQELQAERKSTKNALDELKKSHEKISENSNALELAKQEAEDAKEEALNNLEVIVKKSQIETFDKIVKYMLISIVGGIILLNVFFGIALFMKIDNQTLMTTWASSMTMVFTNAFSIIATIMGVKKIMQQNKDGESSTTFEK